MTRENILYMIGVEGLKQQQRYFYHAKENDNAGQLHFAQNFQQERQKYINLVRAGKFAQFGITENDIVE